MSRRVLVLVVPQVHLLDLGGPVQTFYEANAFGGDYRIVHCGASPRVVSAQGLALADLAPLPEVRAGDLVLVPGIESSTLDGPGRRDGAAWAWLRSAVAAGATVASICSGAFVLGRAGLLDGRACTTHWKLCDRLQQRHPAARVVENRLFVEDGSVLTSAGEASGIDLALSLVERDHGPHVVARVAREMVVYLRRAGEGEQISIYLDHRTHLHPGVHRVQDYLVSRPEENPSIDALGAVAGMSGRNLTRVFRRETGITVKTFAHKVKLQVARDLFASPDLTVEAVAARCGFKDARQLRRLWRTTYGTNPASWRERRL
jgi:transcriptional regulator GlxA family with amidase domain